MQASEFSDIVIEAIEILINHILYIRQVYPQCIFKKRRVYNTPVFVSIYPPLNGYILNVLNTARMLVKNNELKMVELLVFRNEDEDIERYQFCLEDVSKKNETIENNDEYLLVFEESLRYSLHKMPEILNILKKLESDIKCKILLHTSYNAFVKLTQNPEFQEFPWIRFPLHSTIQSVKKKERILPLTEINSIGLQMIVEF